MHTIARSKAHTHGVLPVYSHQHEEEARIARVYMQVPHWIIGKITGRKGGLIKYFVLLMQQLVCEHPTQ